MITAIKTRQAQVQYDGGTLCKPETVSPLRKLPYIVTSRPVL